MATSTDVEATMDAHHYTRTARMKPYPPTTPFSKQVGNGSSDNVHQSASHLLLPTHCLRQSGSTTNDSLWWEIFITSKDIVGISIPCDYLKIQKASNSRPLQHGKGSCKRTLCAHPASGFPLGILHSPVCNMPSQDKHIISHSCLKTRPMVFPIISTSLRQAQRHPSHEQMPRPYSVPLLHSPP